jgi:uncharacterized membrane protein YkoI
MLSGRSVQRRLRQGSGAGRLLPALFCALLPLTAAAHSSDESKKAERQQRETQRQELPRQVISLDQAIAMAEQRYKARVVRADTTDTDGRRYHVLRLLSQEGRVWTVRIDAATGQER